VRSSDESQGRHPPDRVGRRKGYDVVANCARKVAPHVAAQDHLTKTGAGQAKTRFRGRERVEASFTLVLAAYNLIRLPKLVGECP